METINLRNNFKKIDFHPTSTPLRTQQIQPTDFYSSQKQKYENQNLPRQSYSSMSNVSMIMANPDSNQNQKELYDHLIPIKIKSYDREEYQTYLKIRISLVTPSPSHNNILHFELTDETNHLFLYLMDLNETDFLALKAEQCILVDFQGFPPRLVEMLELCMNSANSKEEKATFGCVFEVKNNGDGFFSIIESNQFRVLTHMSLKFREATDQILKKFLAQRLTEQKSQNEELRHKVERLEDGLMNKSGELEKTNSELRKFQEEMEKKIQKLLLEEQKKLHEDKQNAFEKETKLIRDYEDEKKQLIGKYEQSLRESQIKIENLLQNVQELQEIRLEKEAKERELINKLKLLEKETSIQQKEVENLRLDNKSLEKTRFEQEKIIAELSAKASNLEQHLNSKEILGTKANELLESANAQKAMLEENIAALKKANEKLEQKCQICSEEINKGNEILEKLQNDIANQKQKLKLKNAVVVQQEQAITQHQDNIDKLNKLVNELQRENDSKDLKIKSNESTIADLKTKLEQAQDRIEQNQHMINYLNQRLNENTNPLVRTGFVGSAKYTSSLTQGLPQDTFSTTMTPGPFYSQYATNYEKYGKSFHGGGGLAHENISASATSTIPLSLSKTLTSQANNPNNDKSPIRSYEYDKEPGTTNFYKENINFNSTKVNQSTLHEYISGNTMEMTGYSRGPIKYKDPSKQNRGFC